MTRLRLLSYNVHGLHDDVAALTRVVRAAQPDVMCVQEAPRRFRWRHKCADLARRCGMYVAAGGGDSLGNLLLVSLRVRVLETWSMRFPLTPGRHLRGAAFARCAVPGSRFLLVGSHLATDDAERPQQAALLRAACGGNGDPVLIGADLNETDSGLAWRTLRDGRTDVGEGTGPTYSTLRPKRRIDAVFADPACKPTRYEVLDSPDARRASDHFPLLVDFEMPDTGR